MLHKAKIFAIEEEKLGDATLCYVVLNQNDFWIQNYWVSWHSDLQSQNLDLIVHNFYWPWIILFLSWSLKDIHPGGPLNLVVSPVRAAMLVCIHTESNLQCAPI